MPRADRTLSIRPATPADLPALYHLAAAGLDLDVFGLDLLHEKLFSNPDPGQFRNWTCVGERDNRLVGMLQAVERRAQRKGWIGIHAVLPDLRRQGIATRLLEAALADMQQSGLTEVEVLAIPGNYFNPGIDPRYTPALCFAEAHGFERFKDCANMTAWLDERFDTSADEKQLERAGVTIRRARRDDGPLLDAFFAGDFGPDWRMEAGLAMRNDPPAMHLAVADGRIIAFSGHSSQNREWGFFGPMGTTPAARGKGVGQVLLRRCLNDLRDAGHTTAVIPWVGPIGFYSRYCNCRVDRVFWRYRKTLAAPPTK